MDQEFCCSCGFLIENAMYKEDLTGPFCQECFSTHEKFIIHGVNCEKAEHVGSGYLHEENDDTVYDVDGVTYCGRCHTHVTL